MTTNIMNTKEQMIIGNTSVSAVLDIVGKEDIVLQEKMLEECHKMTDTELMLVESIINDSMEKGRIAQEHCLKQVLNKKELPLLLKFFIKDEQNGG